MIVNRGRVAIFAAFLTASLPVRLAAKGDMVKITIQGVTLRTPIEITNTTIQRFTVWAGLGVNGVRMEQAQGFIIDWPRGIVGQPRAALNLFQVSFYEGCGMDESACHDPAPSLCYVVSYAYNASSKTGFVYLPGKADERYKLNVRTIFRGVEGKWFYATSEWNSLVAPLINRGRSETAADTHSLEKEAALSRQLATNFPADTCRVCSLYPRRAGPGWGGGSSRGSFGGGILSTSFSFCPKLK